MAASLQAMATSPELQRFGMRSDVRPLDAIRTKKGCLMAAFGDGASAEAALLTAGMQASCSQRTWCPPPA